MVRNRWRPAVGLLSLAACSATVVEPQEAAAPAAQTMHAAPSAPAAAAPRPPDMSPEPGFCDRTPPGMRCVPGGPLDGVELSLFYIDLQPVRAAEYAACSAAGACTRKPARKTSSPDDPAVLDWQRAREVCAWLGKRLPSEWEWQRAGLELPAGRTEWTATAAASSCGDACTGRDPLGPCDGAHPCGSARVLRGAGDLRLAEPLGLTRREPNVRCASGSPVLTHWPPRQISDPYPAPPLPAPLSERERDLLAGVDQDPIEDKHICGDDVRADWSPSLRRGGRATTTCRDPFPYIKANEARPHVFAPYIANVGGAYLGVASDQNYSLIAAARSEVAWLMDYDPRVVAQHRRLRAFILRSATPAEFVARFGPEGQRDAIDILDEVYARAPDLGALKAGYRATREDLWSYYESARAAGPRDAREFGWLRNPEHYAYVRELYRQGRIVPVKGDLMGERTIRSIAGVARELGLVVRVVYLSNAPSAWGGELVRGFRDNLRALPFDARSLVLQTTNGGGFRQSGYWHYSVADGLHVQHKLGLPGYDRMVKLLAGRIPTPDGDVTVLALPTGPG